MAPLKVSASQIKTWIDCQRRWGYEYVSGLRPPSGAAAALGGEVHSILEGWVKGHAGRLNGKAFNIASRATDEVHRLKTLDTKVEHHFSFVYDEVIYNGFIDAHVVNTASVLIVDWKTSSNPDQWGLTEDTLPLDVQALIYAKWGTLAYDKSQAILRWVYLDTRRAVPAKPVEVVMSRVDVDHAFNTKVHPKSLEILAGRSKAAIELPQNFASCGNFGGCPHISYCHASASKTDRLRSLMSAHLRDEASKKANMSKSLLSMLEADGNITVGRPSYTIDKPEEHSSTILARGLGIGINTEITEPEAAFVALQPAANPPEEAPTEAGREAQAAAYEAAGQRLPPKKRGRPAGSKNKAKPEESALSESDKELAKIIAAEPTYELEPTPQVHIYDLDGNDAMTTVTTSGMRRSAINKCLGQVLDSANALDALHWARAAVELSKV